MTSADQEPVEIEVCSPEHYGAALWLATGGRSLRANRGRVTALLAAEKEGRIGFDGLFVGRRGPRIVGAAWCLLQPGRIATLWGPNILPSEQDTLASRLVQQARVYAQQEGVHLVQSLLETDRTSTAQHLVAGGFREITQVEQRVAVPEAAGVVPAQEALQLTKCADMRSSSFQQLVARTYEGSLDCPELDGLRQIEDVLDGYLSTCGGHLEHWYTLHCDGQTAGTILLAHHAEIHQLELIYFGLLPSYRQRGLGAELIRFALLLGARLQCETITTGVDVRNVPAVALYAQFGFQLVDSKRVFLLPLAPRSVAVA